MKKKPPTKKQIVRAAKALIRELDKSDIYFHPVVYGCVVDLRNLIGMRVRKATQPSRVNLTGFQFGIAADETGITIAKPLSELIRKEAKRRAKK